MPKLDCTQKRMLIIQALTAAIRWYALSTKEEIQKDDAENLIIISDLMTELITKEN